MSLWSTRQSPQLATRTPQTHRYLLLYNTRSYYLFQGGRAFTITIFFDDTSSPGPLFWAGQKALLDLRLGISSLLPKIEGRNNYNIVSTNQGVVPEKR